MPFAVQVKLKLFLVLARTYENRAHTQSRRACVMPVVMMYDIIVFKTSVFILSHVNEKLAFSKISTMVTVLEKSAFLVPVYV